MILPWQEKQWQQLWQMKLENRLPHALLFSGMAGIGKSQLAQQLVQAMLCEKSNLLSSACQACHACRLVMTHVHPDVLFVEPKDSEDVITIDQIRRVSDFIHQSSLQGKEKAVVIRFADQMNIFAANALLKTLEEPSSGSFLILISHYRERLPATIRSRCQLFFFPTPPRDVARTWLSTQLKDSPFQPELLLKITHGAPFGALQLIKDDQLALREHVFAGFNVSSDPVQTAATLQDYHAIQIVDLSLSWINDLLRLQWCEEEAVINQDYATQLRELKKNTNINYNTRLMVYLLELRKQLCQGIHLNKQLMAESIFIRWKMGMENETTFSS